MLWARENWTACRRYSFLTRGRQPDPRGPPWTHTSYLAGASLRRARGPSRQKNGRYEQACTIAARSTSFLPWNALLLPLPGHSPPPTSWCPWKLPGPLLCMWCLLPFTAMPWFLCRSKGPRTAVTLIPAAQGPSRAGVWVQWGLRSGKWMQDCGLRVPKRTLF